MNKPAIGSLFEERYKIISELGSGGMGVVFHAIQMDIGRDVALKFLSVRVSNDDESVARFMREFKLLAKLSHPHIVGLYGMALTEAGEPYAVCEYLNGRTLRRELESGALDWTRALKISVQICEALEEAHNQGISHRDLKPENVMLVDLPEPDFVKIVDFGLSRILQLDAQAQQLTKTGALIGTAQYMSPEHITGKPADTQSDIYALGCLLFELISGSYLFNASSMPAILQMQVNCDPAPRLQALSRCPVALIVVLSKMLEKDPEKRYQQISEIKLELKKILDKADNNQINEPSLRNSKKRSVVLIGLFSFLLLGGFIATGLIFQRNALKPTTLTRKVHIHSLSAKVVAAEGKNLLKHEQYLQAISKLKEAIARDQRQHDPTFNISDVHISLGAAYGGVGKYADQVKEIKMGIVTEKSPKIRIYDLQHLITAFDALHTPEETIKAYRTALAEYDGRKEPSVELVEAQNILASKLLSQQYKKEAYETAMKTLVTADELPFGRSLPGAVSSSWIYFDLSKGYGKQNDGRRELNKTKAQILSGLEDQNAFASPRKNCLLAISSYGIEAADRGLNKEAKEMLSIAIRESNFIESSVGKGIQATSQRVLDKMH